MKLRREGYDTASRGLALTLSCKRYNRCRLYKDRPLGKTGKALRHATLGGGRTVNHTTLVELPGYFTVVVR